MLCRAVHQDRGRQATILLDWGEEAIPRFKQAVFCSSLSTWGERQAVGLGELWEGKARLSA